MRGPTGGVAGARRPLAARALDFATAARACLEDLQERFGMDSWVVARRRGDDYVVIATAQDGEDVFGNRVGLVRPWEETYCARMVDRTAPMVATDVEAVPAYAQVRALLALTPSARLGTASRSGAPEAGAAAPATADDGARLPLAARSYASVPVEGPDGELLGALCGAGLERRGPELEAALPSLLRQAAVLGVLLSHELHLARERRRAERAESAATTDSLTGVANRRAWDAALAAEEARAGRYATQACVLVLDLDFLKDVNDRGGHADGDALLRRTAELLRDRVRSSDLLARLGGDEFGLLLVETPRAAAEHLLGDLRSLLSDKGVEASFGLASREGGLDLHDTWCAADAAMYEDKVARRGARPATARRAPVPATAAPPSPVALTGVDALLSLVRDQLDMDAAYVARLDGERLTFHHVSAREPALVREGESEAYAGTYCRLVVAGELEEVVPDLLAHPVTSALAITRDMGLGAYVGIPLRRSDGRLYGTLCTLSRTADQRLRPRDAEVLRSLSPVLVDLLEEEERREAGWRTTLAEIDQLSDAGGPSTVLQSLVALADGTVVGAEALSRFPEPRTSPQDWFERAARAGAAERLDLACLRAALAHAPRVPGRLSVNASPRTVLTPAFARLVGPGRLDHLAVEITEHEPVDDYGALGAVLAPLRARGLAVAVDDAGAGFASMRHVVQLSPDLVKIDMSIVREVHRSRGGSAMAAALVGYAQRTGALTVAEGVETVDELEHLRGLGVDLVQGYLLAPPVPAASWAPTLPPDAGAAPS